MNQKQICDFTQGDYKMAKFHINSNDEAKECTATVRACRFGPADGENHFDTLQEAQAEAEKRVESNEGGVFAKKIVKKEKKQKQAKNTPDAPLTGHMTISELNKLAKVSEDQKVLVEAVQRNSPRIRGSVLTNEHVGVEVLRELYKTSADNAEGKAERKTITQNRNYPVEDLTADELYANIKKLVQSPIYAQKFYTADNIDDEKAEKIYSASPKSLSNLSEMVFNTNNQLSKPMRKKIIDSSSNLKLEAIEKGWYKADVVERFTDGELTNAVYLHKTQNPALLNAFTDNMIKRDFKTGWTQLSNNKDLPAESIDKIVKSGVIKQHTDELHHHKNISPETKKEIEKQSPRAAIFGKAERATGTKDVFEAQKALVKKDTSQKTEQGGLNNNSWRTTKVQLDKDKIEKAGLTKQEVQTLFSYGYNAGGYYNEETGIFSGTIDSSG